MCVFDPSLNALENFKKNPLDCKFKRGRGGGGGGGGARQEYAQDSDLVDLNTLVLEGSAETIASRVAPFTEPQLDVSQVQSVIFDDMVGKSFPPQSGMIYALRSFTDLRNCVINEYADFDRENGVNRMLTHENLCNVPCASQMTAEFEKKGAQSRLMVSHAILPLLDVAVIEDAFYSATMTATYPRTKAIKGIMMDQYPDLFRVADWSEEFIQAWIDDIDGNARDVPVTRSRGVCVANTEQRLTTMEQNMFMSFHLNGSRTDHDDAYFDICTARKDNYSTIFDWELEQAKRVTFLAGIPLDDAVFYTDAEVARRYKAYVERHPECASVTNVDMDYPLSIINERKEDAAMAARISAQQTRTKRIAMSSDYVENAQRAFAPPRRPQHERLTGRSIQERRAAPMPIGMQMEEMVAPPAPAAPASVGGGRSLLTRLGVNARNN